MGKSNPREERVRRASTLLEVLVVMSILAAIMAIVLPGMQAAQEHSRIMVCKNNLREVGTAVAGIYLRHYGNLPWTYLHNAYGDLYPGSCYLSAYTWGGMKAPQPWPDQECGDWALVPPELRPLNKYIAPDARGNEIVEIVQCPSDTWAISPSFGEWGEELSSQRSTWETYGNSYSINWEFMNGPGAPDDFWIDSLMDYGKEIVKQSVGGNASKFALIWEQPVDWMLVQASPTGGGRQGMGWHGRFSYHTILFLDGHVSHAYFDTRYTRGTDWTVWKP
jgi:prepilin-type processing-associated H-X9-DG protein